MGQKTVKKVRRYIQKASDEVRYSAEEAAREVHFQTIVNYMDSVCTLKRGARRRVCRQVMRQVNPFNGKSVKGKKEKKKK